MPVTCHTTVRFLLAALMLLVDMLVYFVVLYMP